MRVTLVGGSGLVGTALARTLLVEGHQPVVVDRRPPMVAGVSFVRCDIVCDDVTSALAVSRGDAVVHLAARVDPPSRGGREAMRRLHVDGTSNVVRAVESLGIRRLVLVSSAVVYGARAGHDAPFLETDPARPHPKFPYAVDKCAQEDIVRSVSSRHSVVILRPAVIYDRSAKNYLTEMLRRAPLVLPAIDGCMPDLDFVHATDVARAVCATLGLPAATRDTFNVPSAAAVSYRDAAHIAGLRVVAVPRRLLAPALDVLSPLMPPRLRAPSYVLDQLQHPFVMNGAKIVLSTGYRPLRTAADTLREMLSSQAVPANEPSPSPT